MDKDVAVALHNKLRIATDQIVREEYEMILLQGILASSFGKMLVFRGGTALRLAYKSPRFSDDLDFSALEPIDEKVFQKWCRRVVRDNPNMAASDARRKYFTLFALFKIKDPTLAKAISIKVEISTRKNELWTKSRDYTLMNIESGVTPLVATGYVATVERIEAEKKSISPKRIRDVFDLWFIGQKLGKQTPMDFSAFDKQDVRAQLHKYLAQGQRELIVKWLQDKK